MGEFGHAIATNCMGFSFFFSLLLVVYRTLVLRKSEPSGGVRKVVVTCTVRKTVTHGDPEPCLLLLLSLPLPFSGFIPIVGHRKQNFTNGPF
jgi:hypothetical protein